MTGLVYIRYKDHVLFSNSDGELMEPVIRECVGWIGREIENAVLVVWDKTVMPIGEGRKARNESGLAIVKTDILELEYIDFQHRSRQNRDLSLLSGSQHNQNMPNTRSQHQAERKIRLKLQKENGKT